MDNTYLISLRWHTNRFISFFFSFSHSLQCAHILQSAHAITQIDPSRLCPSIDVAAVSQRALMSIPSRSHRLQYASKIERYYADQHRIHGTIATHPSHPYGRPSATITRPAYNTHTLIISWSRVRSGAGAARYYYYYSGCGWVKKSASFAIMEYPKCLLSGGCLGSGLARVLFCNAGAPTCVGKNAHCTNMANAAEAAEAHLELGECVRNACLRSAQRRDSISAGERRQPTAGENTIDVQLGNNFSTCAECAQLHTLQRIHRCVRVCTQRNSIIANRERSVHICCPYVAGDVRDAKRRRQLMICMHTHVLYSM